MVLALREGDLFDARFRIERLLGRGGMGEVWAARDRTEGDRLVAVKVLLEKAARKPDLVKRFEREARIAATVKSPCVCELITAGRSPSGELYLVFELLQGESMGDRLKRENDMPFADVSPVVDDVLEGLVCAHKVGVVHRDLKPANIFLVAGSARPHAKILDFGISKLLPRGRTGDERSLTNFDATLGSFAYMAPEQVRGAARADERADLYAVGAVVFRSLSGRLPFEATTAAMLVSEKLEKDPPTLEQATGERWPAGIERFLTRTLARKREDRYSSVAEAQADWRSVSNVHRRALASVAPAMSAMDATRTNGPEVTETNPPEDGPARR